MLQYQRLVRRILAHGYDVPDRTGTGARALFGQHMRFNLANGFPLVTSKRTFWKGAFVEMLWFLRGDTNIAWLHQHGVHIWDEWADENGDLGPIYGAQWRNWRDPDDGMADVDQLQELIRGLRHNPHSRRHIISAWNPTQLPLETQSPQQNAANNFMALAPCHCLVQFHVDPGNRLHCQLYQRSADVFLGVPFNLAGYALLTHLLAHHLGYDVGHLVWVGGDVHLYQNHLTQAQEMVSRVPRELPALAVYHPRERPLWEIEPHELHVANYHPHPPIHAEVSV